MRLRVILAVSALLPAVFIPSFGGVVDPALRELLAATPDTALVRVMARLADRTDLRAISRELALRNAPRPERHRVMITALQAKAVATQGALLDFLAGNAGAVRSLRSYWIDNLVEFEGTPRVIDEVAARADVEVVMAEPRAFYDPPLDLAYAPESVNSSEPGLRAIRAHLLWNIGITGQGTIVMNIDSGVKGDHPALAARWRGAQPGVPPEHAWYGSGTFPVDSDNPGHGTHTMGIMTGYNPATADTVGVAPGALWIAGAGNYVGAFQWAADPDGNPFTLDDVPDVINCSWFTGGDPCGGGSSYWPLMDNVEIMGAAVIWSAGNCGPGGSSSSCVAGVSPGPYMTITPPKNRVSSDVNAFAVGAVDGNGPSLPIASFSSRGPSACDTSVKKPEVVAPGVNVRSTLAVGTYGNLSGTSMSAPHVAGAVALLRQVNPDAGADELKYALLVTARDLGSAGEDNSYGMGIIDVFAAAEMIAPYAVSGAVTSSGTGAPLRGARVRVLETAQERRSDSSGVYALRPLKDTVRIAFSAFGHRDSILALVLQRNVPVGLDMELASLPTYAVAGTITDSITALGVAAQLSWYAAGDSGGGPTYTVASQNDGTYGFSALAGTYRVEILPPVPFPERRVLQGVVVTTAGATLSVALPEAAVVLVDDDNAAVYDTLYRSSLERIDIGKRRVSIAGGVGPLDSLLALFRTHPVLLWITGNDTTGAMTPAERNLLRSHLASGGNAVITGQNIAEFSSPGDTLLESMLGIRFTGNTIQPFVRGFPGDVIGAGVNYLLTGGAGNQTSKDALEILSGSVGVPTRTLYYGTDSASLAGVRVLGPGALWAAVYFGFGLEGLPPARIDTFLVRSFRYFSQVQVSVADDVAAGIPERAVLEQNYPNPFNPETRIRYGLAVAARVRLTVFDVLGREVATLVDGEQDAGFHEVVWTGTAESGAPAASGVYLCRLDVAGMNAGAGHGTHIRKMILLR